MVRRFQPADKEYLIKIINQINLFSDDEKNVAAELIDETINNPGNVCYNIFVYETEKKILGYHCTGHRALTDGVFDMYWIVVDVDHQNEGIGKKLLEHAENFVMENNGRLLIAETSSQKSYEGTRKFYLRNNYKILADIKDFYKINDNLIIFGKYLKI